MEFLESILIKNKKVENLFFHKKRMENVFNHYPDVFANNKNDFSWFLNLDSVLQDMVDEFFLKNDFIPNQSYKLRLLYDEKINFWEILPYFPKNIQKIAFVDVHDFEYLHKFAERGILNNFLTQKKQEFLTKNIEIDEVILIKNHQLTDTTYSNLIWSKDLHTWHTNANPLLEGTFRRKLLSEKKITLSEITLKNYQNFPYFKPINALLQDTSPVLHTQEVIVGF